MSSQLVYFVVFSIVILQIQHVLAQEDKLLSVVAVYRHGDRSPISSYPNDPYNDQADKLWPDGFGQLTNEGKQRHYNLGQYIRNRYANFLPKTFSTSLIKIYSTLSDRTLMSAQANLAGLFPPEGRQVWNDNLHWQPIPIFPVSSAVLNELATCPKFDILFLELLLSPEFRALAQSFNETFKILSDHSGIQVSTILVADLLGDILAVEAQNNLTLPQWTEDIYPEKLNKIGSTFLKALGYNEALAKLTAGPFLYTVLKHFNKHDSEKLIAYSGHDVNIASILGALDAFEPHNIPYAATIFFELHRKSDAEIVNVYYKNTTEELFPIRIRGCEFDCELSQAWAHLENITISSLQWDAACFLPDVRNKKKFARKNIFGGK